MRTALRSIAITVLAAVTLPFLTGPAAADTEVAAEIRIEGLTPAYALTAKPGDVTTVDLSGVIEGVRIEPASCTYTTTTLGVQVANCAGNDVTVDLAFDAAGGISGQVSTGGGPAAVKKTYTLHCGVYWFGIGLAIYCWVTVSTSA